jgi:regulator of protease activity HflC (stomatin/prohibitin superfamily)
VNRITSLGLTLLVLGGCTFVDATEHCVRTRYGRVVTEQVGPGIAEAFVHDYTCFSMTEQNYPEGEQDKEVVDGVTNDRLPVTVDLALTWEYDPETVFQVFLDKRDPRRVRVELVNAIREGARSSLAAWTIDDLIGPRRAELGAHIAAAINAKLGHIANVKNVYVRAITLPEEITRQQLARIEAVRERETAMERFKADSVTAFTRQYQAEVDANIKQIQAQVYENTPAQLQLEIATAQANALAQIFAACTSQCILGGTATDAYLSANGRR